MATTESINVRDSYEITDEMRENVDNPFYNLDGVNSFTFINNEKMTQSALALIYNALYGLENQDKIPELEEAYRNAQAGLDAQAARVEAARESYYAFSAFLDRISAQLSGYQNSAAAFKDIVADIIDGPIVTPEQKDAQGNITAAAVRSGGLKSLKDDFAGYVNGLGLKVEGLDIDGFATKSQALIDALKDLTLETFTGGRKTQVDNALKDFYAYACSPNEVIRQLQKRFYDDNSEDYIELLFRMATNQVNSDYCGETEYGTLSGAETAGVLLTQDNMKFTVSNDIGLALKQLGFLDDASDDLINSLTDAEKRAILGQNVLSKTEDEATKYYYPGSDSVTYDSVDACITGILANLTDKAKQDLFQAVINNPPTLITKVNNTLALKERVWNILSNPPSNSLTTTQKNAYLKLRKNLVDGLGNPQAEYAKDRANGLRDMLAEIDETGKVVESYFYSNTTGGRLNTEDVVTSKAENPNRWCKDGLYVIANKNANQVADVQAAISENKKILEDALNRSGKISSNGSQDSAYKNGSYVWNWDNGKNAQDNLSELIKKVKQAVQHADVKLEEAQKEYSNASSASKDVKDRYYRARDGRVEDLLNFAIRYNPYDGEGEKITKIFLNEDGTYSINEPKAASNGSVQAQTASMSNEATPASYSLYSTNAMTAPYSLNSEDFGEDDTETIATQAATSRMLNMARSAAAPATYSLNSDENVGVSLLSDSPNLTNTAATLSSVGSTPQVRAAAAGFSAANMQDSLENKALPYYVLAVCLTFARGVQDQMMLKISGPSGTTATNDLSSINGINDAIKENNRYLRWLNSLYDQYYTQCSTKDVKGNFDPSTIKVEGLSSTDIQTYINNTCGYKFSCNKTEFKYGNYNNMGDEGTGANIDVEEQRNLTKISNAQEAVRMRGDELNTMSQMATTQLQNLTQKYNTFISVCSQLAKSTGDYFKTIAGNIR